jgi:hypothetical protein
MPVTAPPREQSMEALAQANQIREKRAALKRDLKAGRILLSEALFMRSRWLRTMRVYELLRAAPGIGERKADLALRACKLTRSSRLGHLTTKSRATLLGALASRSPGLRLIPDSGKAAA